ncbi:MAG: winged helix-turn-helix transcriptional regulator [Bauldia sp.]|nr:winged helix-turn-helix transcriptional regulator [Bauldia sp.]
MPTTVALEPRLDEASGLLSAMANPKRLLILCHLLSKELSVSQLASRVDLGQSPLSQHLARLRALRLVIARRDGQSIRYRLASPEVAEMLATLHRLYCEPPESAGQPPVGSRDPAPPRRTARTSV